VLPSIARSEAFGIVQLEAMAAGKPVVNTALDSGVPYVSVHEKTGLTVPPGSAEAIANALNTLLASEWLRGQYGAAARQRVYEEFTVSQMGARTFDVYRHALGLPAEREAAVGSAA
jgi:rhamnosyl/mannosyltransferase